MVLISVILGNLAFLGPRSSWTAKEKEDHEIRQLKNNEANKEN